MKEVQSLKPYVTLYGKLDTIMETWEKSRPHLDPATFIEKDILSQDLPIHSFATYQFEIRGSLLFRDLCYTLRPVDPWARSNRTNKLSLDNQFLIDENDDLLGYERNPLLVERDKKLLISVVENIDLGYPQDKEKIRLPLTLGTVFLVGFNRRTLLNFILTLREKNVFLYYTYGIPMMEAAGIPIDHLDYKAVRSLFEFFNLNENDAKLTNVPQTVGDITGIKVSIVYGLHSQFIRQNYSIIKSSLWNYIAEYDVLNTTLTSSDKVDTVLYTKSEAWKKLLSVRNCWFADFNPEMWSSVLGGAVKDMTPNEYLEVQPCKGCGDKCPVKEDIMARVYRAEINFPCPILINDPSMVDKRLALQGDSVQLSKWIELKDSGLIIDDVNDPNRVIYESISAEGKGQ